MCAVFCEEYYFVYEWQNIHQIDVGCTEEKKKKRKEKEYDNSIEIKNWKMNF